MTIINNFKFFTKNNSTFSFPSDDLWVVLEGQEINVNEFICTNGKGFKGLSPDLQVAVKEARKLLL